MICETASGKVKSPEITALPAFQWPRRGFLRGFDGGLAFGVGCDPDLDIRRQILGELDTHGVLLDLVELAGEIDVVGLDVVALRLKRLGDVGGADRAEQMAVLVGPAFERDLDAFELS